MNLKNIQVSKIETRDESMQVSKIEASKTRHMVFIKATLKISISLFLNNRNPVLVKFSYDALSRKYNFKF